MKLADLLSVLDSRTRIRIHLVPSGYVEDFRFRELENSPLLDLAVIYVGVDIFQHYGIDVVLKEGIQE